MANEYLTVQEALTAVLAGVSVLPAERVLLLAALGRVLAEAVVAQDNLPPFANSSMDGYAMQAADLVAASQNNPVRLRVVADIAAGSLPAVAVTAGTAARIMTGAPLPAGADAVVPVEDTDEVWRGSERPLPATIQIFRPVQPGDYVRHPGEDIKVGQEVLAAGHVLRPQEIGVLASLGVSQVPVIRQPRVGILATGDEVIAPTQTAVAGQIRDINSYTVAGQVRQAGGIPLLGGIVLDNLAALQQAAADMLAQTDMLVMSAGSSVSVRDMTVTVIDGLGKPGVLLHGVATRPGKPTIVGAVGGKPVLGLPGNPVSAMVQFDMFGTPTIYRLQGMAAPPRRGLVWAKLTQNVASESGREDYVPARLADSADGLLATPVFGKSNLIYTLVNADGLIKIPLNKGGVLAGELVEVKLF